MGNKEHKKATKGFYRTLITILLGVLIAVVVVLAFIIFFENRNSPSEEEEISTTTPLETELSTETEEGEAEPVETTLQAMTVSSLNLRSEASVNGDIVAVIPQGTEISVVQNDESDFWKATYGDYSGYVSKNYISIIGDTAASGTVKTRQQMAENGYSVCIDPGHQAHGDSTTEPNGPGSSTMKARVTGGTKGTVTGVYEYELNLEISQMLKEELELRGYTVYMTRETHDVNISNKERAEYATSVDADITVRVHANGADSESAQGAMMLVPSASNAYVGYLAGESQSLAQSIISHYCASTGMENDGVSQNDTMTGINWSTMPVTIIELGYMTNPTDDINMEVDEYQVKMVTGIADGIDEYFGL